MFTARKILSLPVLSLTFVIFLSVPGLVVTWASSSSEPQGKQRAVQLIVYRDQPIEITSIKVGGVPIESRRKFKAGSDWLNGMTITLKNVYDRPVAYVSVLISAYYEKKDDTRRKREGRDVLAGSELKYGTQPPRPGDPSPPYTAPLLPGESVDIVYTEQLRDQLYSMLKDEQASTDLMGINVRVYSVFFLGDSDTQWGIGGWLRRDANNPDWFRPVRSHAPSSRATKKRRSVRASHARRRRALAPPEDTVIDPCTHQNFGNVNRDCAAYQNDNRHHCIWQDGLLAATRPWDVLIENIETQCSGRVSGVDFSLKTERHTAYIGSAGCTPVGLKAISLDYKGSRRTDEYGNMFRYRARVDDTRDANIARWAWDVFLIMAR